MVLYMASNSSGDMVQKAQGRRTYSFLGHEVRRQCFEKLMGLSSHRVDRIGLFDQRYSDTKKPGKPSALTASIDSFVMVLYNSIAEPLPDRYLDFIANDAIFPGATFFSLSLHI